MPLVGPGRSSRRCFPSILSPPGDPARRDHRRTLWAIPLRAHGILQAGRSRPRYASGATGIGKLEHGSRPKAINEIARLRRSLPEPDPENRAAISIRGARPPIITVMSGLAAPDHHPLPALAAEVIVGGWPFPLDLPARAPRLKWLHQRPAGGARGSHLPDQLLGLAHFPAIPHLALAKRWRTVHRRMPVCSFHPIAVERRNGPSAPHWVENKFNEIKLVRQIDDQPLDLALTHRGQLGGDDLDMPIHRELGLRADGTGRGSPDLHRRAER